MVKFESIIIKNYKSIEYAELFYRKGVWLVEGTNVNSMYKSNGAGKSTVLEAIQQCLYNRNIKGIKIDSTFNRNTNKPYCISIKFNSSGHAYKVVNSREDGISIFEDSKDLGIKSTAQTLSKIQEIIGLDFNTFCTLTYVSHQTIVSLLDNFSSSDLMKTLLDFDSIMVFDKKTKEELKASKVLVSSLLRENNISKDALDLLSEFTHTDTTPLLVRLSDIQEALTNNPKIQELQKYKDNLVLSEATAEDYKLKIASLEHKLDTKCKLCGSTTEILSEGIKTKLNTSIADCTNKLMLINTDITKIQQRIVDLTSDVYIVNALYYTEKMDIESKLSIIDYKNKVHSEKVGDITKMQQRIAANTVVLNDEYFNQDLYNSIITTIKSGKLHKDLLMNFCKVLNTYITEYTQYIDLDTIIVRTIPLKNSIEFSVYDSKSKSAVELNTLSGGELTRIRIVLLLSMLKTVQVLTKVNINILVLDEALDTLDESASQDLSNLFQHLVSTEDKFIALISHGNQLKDIEFTGKIQVTKTINSEVQQIEQYN